MTTDEYIGKLQKRAYNYARKICKELAKYMYNTSLTPKAGKNMRLDVRLNGWSFDCTVPAHERGNKMLKFEFDENNIPEAFRDKYNRSKELTYNYKNFKARVYKKITDPEVRGWIDSNKYFYSADESQKLKEAIDDVDLMEVL